MKIDTKKIGTFLKSLEDVEYIYLKHVVGIRSSIQELINNFNLSKEDVCIRFKIQKNKYNDFVKGNYSYSLMDVAHLNAAFNELMEKKKKEDAQIDLAK